MPPFFGVDEHPDGTLLNPFFEGDVIEAALSLKVATDVVSIFGNYGLTDRWDVGLAVPIVHVDMDATVLATIKRLATGGQSDDSHLRRRTGRAADDDHERRLGNRPRRHRGADEVPAARTSAPAASPRRRTSGCRPATRTTCSAAARR